MNKELQIIMIISSLLFLCYIILMLRNKKIELKFTLSWLFTGTCFLVFAIFPDLLRLLSNLLRIVEPVNTLFLFTIFFMLLIIFTLTIALSRNATRVKTLTQEIGILKMELKKLSDKMSDSPSKKALEK
jgi:hypothetical protein